MSSSKRRMILIMFQNDTSYFPSIREIQDELIQAQLHEIQKNCQDWDNTSYFEQLKSDYARNWNILFDLAKLGDKEKPLTTKILANPNHNITKHILYLYSMESFIYEDMNRASREKDVSKIKYYGAFAAALSYILYFANNNRLNKRVQGSNYLLYRGVKLAKNDADSY